ncbi:MAG: trigger factor [Chlamydiae bacterium RIFCSPHIGHO2_12_FULL_44_59]|nr:MAG: trigger factor [Chlamydiae bacterium RIFCSPHIGHO2_01_FULL_44_39]OGN56469.1 MAG: trigger factor [Chlamydiae bacterium RIFCSPHIGHO2_02_FULL_45_9]OGN60328.1 MAG: trigger factor [Chlamydiae bacterium RIFCSPHIGHO2_12_FULL_44_59]OGN66311.1 MAG: trigger factor [Chlamydiae bacterium RIFCSPLOWO2_01_FULL_44_52]OGN69262.1 MAG: trigger factor [Chlamydiae bacterium RIFCSPLOWO2_02_FULL_45_22]
MQIEEKAACRIEMHVSVSTNMLKEARKKAAKIVAKEITLPGFRRGKAPEEMVLKKYPAQVEKQLHKTLADLAYEAAQKLANLPLLNNNAQIHFDLKNMRADGASLLFSFEVEPKLPTIDCSAFQETPIKRPEVSDREIEEAIRQMRFFYAKWTSVTDRPIQDGDYIMINLDTIDNGTPTPVFNQIRFEVSKSRMAHWMNKLVEGAKAGDVLEGVSEPDEDATEEDKKEFSPKNVRITLIKVELAELPNIDDDFAQKVGAPNVETMRTSLSNHLNFQAEEKVVNEKREQVNAFLLEKYPVDLPRSLIETEKKHRISQLARDPQFQKEWESLSQEERKSLDNKVEKEATDAVRLFYLSRQLVQDKNILVSHQEVQHEAVAMIQANGHRNVDIDKLSKEIYALAFSKVLLLKAQDHILKKA